MYPKFIKQGDIIGVPTPSDGAYCEEDVRRYKNSDGPTVKFENEKFVCNHNSFDYNFTVKNAKCMVADNGYKIEPNDNCFEIIF